MGSHVCMFSAGRWSNAQHIVNVLGACIEGGSGNGQVVNIGLGHVDSIGFAQYRRFFMEELDECIALEGGK